MWFFYLPGQSNVFGIAGTSLHVIAWMIYGAIKFLYPTKIQFCLGFCKLHQKKDKFEQ